MPQIDLEPGSYHERKPPGWRWRLPWSHPEDTKLPLVMLCVMLAGLAYIFFNRDALSSGILFGGTAVAAAIAGGMLLLAFRD